MITHAYVYSSKQTDFLRACLIPSDTGNVSNCISKWTHGGCDGAGSGERGCLGQEKSLGEMEMHVLIGEGDLQVCTLSKFIILYP